MTVVNIMTNTLMKSKVNMMNVPETTMIEVNIMTNTVMISKVNMMNVPVSTILI